MVYKLRLFQVIPEFELIDAEWGRPMWPSGRRVAISDTVCPTSLECPLWVDHPMVDSKAMWTAFVTVHLRNQFRAVAHYLPLEEPICGSLFMPHGKSKRFVERMKEGTKVVVAEEVVTINRDPVTLCPRTVGTVLNVDEEGDAYVEFSDVPERQWVSKRDFSKLKRPEVALRITEPVPCVNPRCPECSRRAAAILGADPGWPEEEDGIARFHWMAAEWAGAYMDLAAQGAWMPPPFLSPGDFGYEARQKANDDIDAAFWARVADKDTVD